MSENMMRAVLLDRYEGFESLRVGEVAVPVPGPGQLLVRVRAAALNPVDMVIASGAYQQLFKFELPVVVGGELAGVVAAVADGEAAWQVGDEVHALLLGSGALAEYALVPAASAVRKPTDMSFAEAAALPTAAATATAALDRGAVGAGTRLVVHSAAGGVGSVLVQLAKARGAHVTALASPANIEFVSSLGADLVVDRTTGAEADIQDADVVIDAFGPPAQERSWSMLRRGGILISLVTDPSAEKAEQHGVQAAKIFGNRDRAVLEAANALYEEGKLKIRVMQQFPIDQTVEAYRLLQSRRATGKVVVKLGE